MLKQGAGFSNDELRILACRGPREILSALDGEPSSGSPAEA
jgi:hypothetical protein